MPTSSNRTDDSVHCCHGKTRWQVRELCQTSMHRVMSRNPNSVLFITLRQQQQLSECENSEIQRGTEGRRRQFEERRVAYMKIAVRVICVSNLILLHWLLFETGVVALGRQQLIRHIFCCQENSKERSCVSG
jgi:hypothetical protein